MTEQAKNATALQLDAIVVGAGFAGLYMLLRLRQLGLRVRVFEAGPSVGGTWYWNSYPGARCDVESMFYSYSFSPELEQEWHWTERYPAQPEILRYLDHVADRFDLRRDIQFNSPIASAHFEEADARWHCRTRQGEPISATYCIMATGNLSSEKPPDFKGLERFAGEWYGTSRWPRESVDFSQKRVGIIGTGSTAIQMVPIVAAEAAHLCVFQRTPAFSIPAKNGPLDPEREHTVKTRYSLYRAMARASSVGFLLEPPTKSALQVSEEERRRAYEAAWESGRTFGMIFTYTDLLTDLKANKTAADFVRSKIRHIVKDPRTAQKLTPTTYPIGTRRVCQDSNYYETFNRSNVELVDIREAPIEEIVPEGVRTKDAVYPVDILVFALGFDAMTGALAKIDIRGRAGAPLRDRWSVGPRTYLGLTVAGFPNLFLITGPGSPSVLSNMTVSIEHHVDWIADCIKALRSRTLSHIEATPEAENAWTQHVDTLARSTLFPLGDSWYQGANIEGKPRLFMPYVGGVGEYRRRCASIALKNYEGFRLA